MKKAILVATTALTMMGSVAGAAESLFSTYSTDGVSITWHETDGQLTTDTCSYQDLADGVRDLLNHDNDTIGYSNSIIEQDVGDNLSRTKFERKPIIGHFEINVYQCTE